MDKPDKPKQTVAESLLDSKTKSLSYYDATRRLKELGYTQEQIADAAYTFDYNQPLVKVADAKKPGVNPDLSDNQGLAKDYVQAGRSILQEKERDARPFAYLGLVPGMGYFAMECYRFYLNRLFWSHDNDTKYLWPNNFGKMVTIGVVAAALTAISLKLYFKSVDRRNNR